MVSSLELRICKRCKVEQSITRFPRARSTSPGVYFEHKCKTCYAVLARERYQSVPEQRALQIARSMNQSISRRSRGATAVEVSVERLVALITSATACAYCHGPLEKFGYAIDHVIPLSNGGAHELSNLAVTCKPCNRAKWDMSEAEFKSWLYGVATRVPNPRDSSEAPS